MIKVHCPILVSLLIICRICAADREVPGVVSNISDFPAEKAWIHDCTPYSQVHGFLRSSTKAITPNVSAVRELQKRKREREKTNKTAVFQLYQTMTLIN